jgi:hypothetical protein
MLCESCQSSLIELPAEINIHPPNGIQNLDKPSVWVFPVLLVCLECGFIKFRLAETELRSVKENCLDIGEANSAAAEK